MKILFRNVTAVTMDPDRPVIQNACVAVEGTQIASVGQEHPRGEFDRVIDGQGKALLPGLVNCHTHVPMALLRGYGGGHDLQHWLNDYIFPAEARLDARCVAAGTALGLAEMIASGTTCIADMYMHTGAVARTVLESGISANLSCGGVYFGAPEDFSPDTCGDCRNQIALTEEWNGAGDGQIKVDASIHAEYTSNPPLWQWMAGYAAGRGLGMHVHVSETRSEHESCLQKYGKTPVALLDQYGVWANGGTAAHCVWVSDGDMELMARRGITVAAHIRSIAQVEDRPFSPLGEARDTLLAVQQAPFPVLEEKAGERMRAEILRAREAGDSVGGVVECIVTGLPAGVGSPMFQGLESHLAAALFAIPAVKGVEFGSGFGAAGMRGSAHNDPFILEDGAIRTASNHAGGILGGISSGMPVVFRAAFKPTPSIAQKQHTVRLSAGTETDLQITGRHDPCIVPRAVPVVEAAAALVLLDALLDRNTDQIAWSAPQGARP